MEVQLHNGTKKRFNMQFINLWTSYAAYYFGRVNLSLIIPLLMVHFGLSVHELGAVASAFLFAYAVGQFVHGHYSERFHPVNYMAVGLICSAFVNLLLGYKAGVFFVLFFGEMLDGFCQSMGWSSCVRAVAAVRRDTREAATCALGTSYQIGNSLAWLVTSLVIVRLGWRWGFWCASIVMMARGIGLLVSKKPRIERSERTTFQQVRATLIRPVIISGISLALLNFVRYGIIIWIPTFLFLTRNMTIGAIGLRVFLIPLAGCIGTLAYNILTRSRRGVGRETLTSIYLLALTAVLFSCPFASGVFSTVLIVGTGLFLYGPHVFLVSTVPGRLVKNKTAASSTGVIDGMGYIGAMLAGIVIPFLFARDWSWAFMAMAMCSATAAFLNLVIRPRRNNEEP